MEMRVLRHANFPKDCGRTPPKLRSLSDQKPVDRCGVKFRTRTENGPREIAVIHRIRKMLRLKTERAKFSKHLAAGAMRLAQIVRGVELHARLIGKHFHDAARF